MSWKVQLKLVLLCKNTQNNPETSEPTLLGFCWFSLSIEIWTRKCSCKRKNKERQLSCKRSKVEKNDKDHELENVVVLRKNVEQIERKKIDLDWKD